MCDPTTIALVAVGTAVAGMGTQYIAGQNAASAASSAQQQAQEAQNAAFNARMSAQREQLAGQTAINTAANQRFTENQAATYDVQSRALAARGAATQAMNDQQAATSQRADQIVEQGTQDANASNLAAAQQNQVQAQQTANAPVVAQVAASNPLGAASSGSVVTKQAMDTRMKGAADYVKNYGDTQAVLSGYNAPVNTAQNAATTIGTNLMPASVADQLVRTGAPAILAPTTTAYQQAGAYGQSLQEANTRTAGGLTAIEATRAQNAIDLATLDQTDTTNNIQSNLIRAQTSAAQLAGLGSGLSAIGSAGLGVAGAQGAFSAAPAAAAAGSPVAVPPSAAVPFVIR